MFSMSSFRLDGRVALVTGAGQGLGSAVAEAYAQAKAHSSPKAEGYMPDYATGFKSGGIATL